MIRILLDTSAYSAFFRGHEEIKQALQQAEEIYLNPVIIGELKAGFLKGKDKKKNERLLQEFLASPRVKVLTVDEDTSDRYAVIWNTLRLSGTPITTNDLWIAASAMQYGLTVVTTDSDFSKVSSVLVTLFPPVK